MVQDSGLTSEISKDGSNATKHISNRLIQRSLNDRRGFVASPPSSHG